MAAANSLSLPKPWPDFLKEIEAQLSQPVKLHCLGGFVPTALYGIPRFTADLDYIDAAPATAADELEKIAGRASTLGKKYKLFVQNVGIADLPENYERFPDAFQFIKDVAVDWDDSKYLEAEPGKYLTVARNARGTGNWFVGNVNGDSVRISAIDFRFLAPGRKYLATVYTDAPDAHYKTNPQAYVIRKYVVTRDSKLRQRCAPGGGYAISLFEAKPEELKGIKPL